MMRQQIGGTQSPPLGQLLGSAKISSNLPPMREFIKAMVGGPTGMAEVGGKACLQQECAGHDLETRGEGR